MNSTPRIKGIPLLLGGVIYTLPPANLATLEAMSAPLDKVNAAFATGAAFGLQDMLFVVDFATACLKRNYPDIDRSVVAENIGLENVIEVLQMCLDTSGLMRQKLEDQAATSTAAQEGGKLGEPAGTASSLTS